MPKLWAGYDYPRNCPDLTNKRSRKAVGEAVGNAKRDRRERNAFSVAVAVALCGSLAVNVVRAVGGVCGRQRWPWGWVCRKRVRLSGGLAGVGVSNGRQWPYRWPSMW